MDDDPVRAAIEEGFVIEREGWASERVNRVTAQLQRSVPAADRFETLVVWTDEHSAFTAPGRTIYISRRLLERFADDDAAAFVVAHELSHHRLGHVPALPRGWARIARGLMLALHALWIATPRREHDADLLAIELCVDAGYDAERCIAALEYLEQVSFDYGDVDGVLGPEFGKDQRSHPALQLRIAAVRTHLAAMRSGYRLPLDTTIQRERRRRRQLALTAAGSATAAVALLVLRRRL